jgi:hypothetical protein
MAGNFFEYVIGEVQGITGNSKATKQNKAGGFDSVETGADVNRIKGLDTALKTFNKAAVLPTSTKKETIKAAGILANQIAAGNGKLAELAQHRMKIAQGIDRRLQIQTTYQSGMQNLNINIERNLAQYGQTTEANNLKQEVIETGYTAWMTEWNGETDAIAAALDSF